LRAAIKPAILVPVILLIVSPTRGNLVIIDPDPYTPGTDISTVFDGLELQTYYDSGRVRGSVYSRAAYDPVLASTGANVFGHLMIGTDAFGRPINQTWRFPQTLLVVHFLAPADWVSFDIIGDNPDGTSDRAAVDVYDADRNLIEWAQTPWLGYAEFARITVDRGSFDISFLALSGTHGAVYIDNLRANLIPEPSSALLLLISAVLLRPTASSRRPGARRLALQKKI